MNWNDNSGGGQLKPVWFNFSEFLVQVLNAKDWAIYQIEPIKKFYPVYKIRDVRVKENT